MDRFGNHKGLIDVDLLAKTRFTVIGAGAIGSAVVVQLSKMGARNITVYDFDRLEDHNFASQMYPISENGKPKVLALKSVAKDYGECDIVAENRPWTDGADKTDVVLCCVDNMDVRKRIFDYYKDKAQFFVDGRMSAMVFRVYGVDYSSPEQIAYYEASLFPQDKAAKEKCGEKSIIFTVGSVASQVVTQVFLWLNKDYRPTEVTMDMYNINITKAYHMVLAPAVYEEEVLA